MQISLRSALRPVALGLLTAPVLLATASPRMPAPLPTTTELARTTTGIPASDSVQMTDGAYVPVEDKLVVAASRVCPGSGYLCDEIAAADGSYRVAHFGSAVTELRVEVPAPSDEPPDRAATLQRAAVRGIDAWNRHPLPIRIVDDPDSADVVVRWKLQLPEGNLGETRTHFAVEDGVLRYRVEWLELASRNPFTAEILLTARDVELTAAHEMGHVLGLPHSTSRGDLMYPTDAATQLSERDFRTVDALYRISNGTRIVR